MTGPRGWAIVQRPSSFSCPVTEAMVLPFCNGGPFGTATWSRGSGVFNFARARDFRNGPFGTVVLVTNSEIPKW